MMSTSGAGMALLFAVVLIFAGVFLGVVCVVACVKIIQIAEDVRYIRSKSDIHVSRPMKMSKILGICVLVTACLVFLLLTYSVGIAGSLSQLSGFAK